MRKRILEIAVVCLMLFPVYILFSSLRSDIKAINQTKVDEYYNDDILESSPCKKADGGKFTIAYVDIDPYPASGEMLYYLIEELDDKGWITLDGELPFDSESTDAKELINYLAEQDLGDYIQFSKDANYYIAVDDREECKKSIQKHVDKGDIDLIFCMGTSPADLVINEMGITKVPVMVYFSVDPVSAGLSETEEYSGRDNVWCHTSSEVYLNQLKFYYDNYNFNNIAIVYYSESVGAMNQYRTAAEKLNVSITEKKIDTLENDDKEAVEAYYEMLKATFLELVDKDGIDAFMLGTDIIKDEGRIEELLDIFYRNDIPVFVQNGEYYVRDGALMCVTASDAKSQAPFAVSAMSYILNGSSPGSIYQKFVISPYVSINMDTADRLGYEVKQELLLSAEKLYSSY